MNNFVHLHVHTEFSLLDGANRIDRLVTRAKELGQQALAITDHGVMYGVVAFYKECKKQGIKPIIGCEVYVAPRTRFDKQHGLDNQPYHLILLCKDETGYQNLIKMVSAAYIEGFYSKPRVDRALLEAHHEGLIALSACLAGEVPRNLSRNDYNEAKAVAEYYHDLFGAGNYYLELQNHGIDDQVRILPLLQRLSHETGIPMVATNDTHYLRQEDAQMQKVLVAIATNRTIHDDSAMEFATEEFYLKTEAEMQRLFGTFEGAVANSGIIAEQCNFDFTFGETKLPKFTAPTGEDNEAYIKNMCNTGLEKYYGNAPEPEIIKRLEYELDIIIRMGYTDYFLIVHDFIAYAKSQGIPVGPGRGSGAGSLVAYCIGITGVDPIKYALLFERFLNPERISMPDFDIDFCYERRQEVIDYVVNKYGADHVAQIITFGTMAARGALRDVGRALGMSYGVVDAIAKAVPSDFAIGIERALEISPEFQKIYAETPENKQLIDMAKKVEGMARHASTHAAGVVITPETADTYVPLQKNDDAIVTQFPMGTLEELGLLKMDFLGLRNLTVIREVEVTLARRGIEFSIEDISLEDKNIFTMLSQGKTNGVFQFESGGMKNVLMQLGPEHMEDLIAVISLYRPGPMDSIPTYVRNRHKPALVEYKHPLLKPILEVTYGVIVYQEQVMQICRELAGYSYARADLVRRAMSKKDHGIMEKERHNFIWGAKKEDGSVDCVGAVANGVNEAIATQIFDEMTAFASYAFNKSHAAAYALISYQTAYLKYYYPSEYIAALLTSVLENTLKVTDYIAEAKAMGIAVLPPAVNESNSNFTVTKEGIRFGLLAVKNLGRGFISELVKEREAEGPFVDLLDFLERLHGKDMNRRAVEGLIDCGAMDGFGHNRRQMKEGFPRLLDNVEAEHRRNITGQLDFFGMADTPEATHTYTLPEIEEYSITIKLNLEKESCGLFLSGHPLSAYEDDIKRLGATTLIQIAEGKCKDNDVVRVLAILTHRRNLQTKKGETMSFLQLEDMGGAIEVIVFPRTFAEYSDRIQTGEALFLQGRVKTGEEEEPQLIAERIEFIDQAVRSELPLGTRTRGEHGSPQAPTRPQGQNNSQATPSKESLYLKMKKKDPALLGKIASTLSKHPGNVPVYYYFADTKRYLRTPTTLWVQWSPALKRALTEPLGEGNVVLQ